ncbi:hypothetical protein [Chromobacterium vaccinii]|uniref:hypothetical protein n=1 Tax=Chromobacterium vaccinii TaxID=1108595 RepID=UPI000E1B146E|nr:hypothetical protein [Chromobacterium vaccinii]SUX30183.1 Uncharacterised protein [Chromobacterium vaccinii]
MSKPRKKYNPRKQRQVWAGESENAFAKVFVLASTERLSQQEINSLSLSMLMSLDTLRSSWCPTSFNLIGHFYRVARIVATEMKIGLLNDACDAAWRVLQDLHETDGNPVPTADQYDVLRYLLDALLALLPEIPLPLWVMAEESSRESIKLRMTEQYMLLPEWARLAAIDVLSGKTVKDLAATLERTEKEVSENVRTAGAILYTLRADSTLPFPSNVTKLRKLGEQLLPVAAQYELAIKQLRRAA